LAYLGFYLTGVVGAGKTTAVEQIRSIDSFDEWVDRKHPLLSKPHQELAPDQRIDIDSWINQQFRKKNRRVSRTPCGISIIDRCPLDPLYFVKENSACSKRAKELIEAMVPEQSSIKEIAPGHLIMLTCDGSVLKTRLANRHKKYKL
jgi:deoxyadenosine/deoxycytidine kinase